MNVTHEQRNAHRDAHLRGMIPARVPCLLLLTSLCTACAVDVSKLRSPVSRASDGGSAEAGGPQVLADGGGVLALPDATTGWEAAEPWDLRTSPEQGSDSPDRGKADAMGDLAPVVVIDATAANPDGDSDTNIVTPDGAPDGDRVDETGGFAPDGDRSDDVAMAGPDGDAADASTGGEVPNDVPVDATVDLGPVVPVTDPDLVLWYKFDESTGATAVDSALWGGVARNATLATLGTGFGGSASFTSASQVGSHAVSLAPSSSTFSPGGGYVSLPSLQTLAPDAMTIAVWINIPTNTSAQTWARVFDFGTGTTAYMFLTVRAQDGANAPVRFSITKSGSSNEQQLNALPALGANAWHHIAVVLAAGTKHTGTLYLDGTAVDSNANMTLHASDLGATTNNWLGRSQWSGSAGSDPFLSGSLDDFRVYRRALSQQEIATLIASP